MSLSNTWQNLVASALLGTERQKPNLTELAFLRGIDTSNPEAALLSASATLGLYKRVGQQLGINLEPKLEKSANETLTTLSSNQQSLLLECLNSRTEQLTECLELAAKAKLRAPFELLDQLIHKANFDSSLRESVLPVLGERGLWLAKHLDAGAWVGGSSLDESVWELGLPAQRRDYLSTLRSSDPQQALQKLEAVWKQEPAKIRSDLIGTLEVNLSMHDEEFLENALDDKGKEVRENAARLLTKLPGSRLMERMKTRVTPLLQYTPEGKSGMLGLKKGTPAKLEVTLPENCDKAMQRDGIELKPPSWQKIGEKAYWLKQMLEIAPLKYWEQTLNATPTELVAATNKHEYQKLILETWRSSLRHYRYNLAWADALKQSGKAEFQLSDYGFVLNQTELEYFILLRLKLPQPPLEHDESPYFLASSFENWSVQLTRGICERVKQYFLERDKKPEAKRDNYEILSQTDYRLQAHLRTYSQSMNPTVALEILSTLNLNNTFENLDAALETLLFRVKLQNAFTGEQR
jgi:Family of unknown function (DUF5691)